MSQPDQADNPAGHEPTRRERLRPLELIGFSAILAIFAGAIVMMSSREFVLSLIFFGVAFIVSLVTLAMLGLGMKPNAVEQLDIQLQDEEQHKKDGDH
ncbi:ABC transporter ATP-binding protein [Lysinibacter sp. HNR]|uniref:ABC transporter ATP-binding protein n=1 Tax=Lysinibacter sp. HNR TaxID=3031408 RepID=UPI002435738A|nr:ABC transporter ATP-binding protein [Lysinibacter sp. HNR]WGD37307.1 ABC transporter ATP-binding protein [Lysinibacter sp. HNR]